MLLKPETEFRAIVSSMLSNIVASSSRQLGSLILLAENAKDENTALIVRGVLAAFQKALEELTVGIQDKPNHRVEQSIPPVEKPLDDEPLEEVYVEPIIAHVPETASTNQEAFERLGELFTNRTEPTELPFDVARRNFEAAVARSKEITTQTTPVPENERRKELEPVTKEIPNTIEDDIRVALAQILSTKLLASNGGPIKELPIDPAYVNAENYFSSLDANTPPVLVTVFNGVTGYLLKVNTHAHIRITDTRKLSDIAVVSKSGRALFSLRDTMHIVRDYLYEFLETYADTLKV